MNKTLITTKNQLQDYFNKPVIDITKQELEGYLEKIKQDYTYSTFRTKVGWVNVLMKNIGSNTRVEIKSGDTAFTEKGIVTKKELYSLIEVLDNAQDKFILLSIYNGIVGKQASDLLNLKRSDIDFVNQEIHIGERVVKMDKVFSEIAMQALNQRVYTKISMSSINMNSVEEFEFSDATQYAVKVRPTIRNNMGINAMSYNGFRTRFADICGFLGLDVTIVSLEKSGYLNRLKEEGIPANINDVQDWIKKEKIKSDKYLLLRLYKEYERCYN